jgi:hypothetical protein
MILSKTQSSCRKIIKVIQSFQKMSALTSTQKCVVDRLVVEISQEHISKLTGHKFSAIFNKVFILVAKPQFSSPEEF